MKEIKFRQPTFVNGKFRNWHYWGFFGDGFTGAISDKSRKKAGDSYQYTGLKDKHSKEIYEGDITCRHWDDGSWQNGQIIYENGSFLWQEINRDRFLHLIGINTLHSEVIGNIYENKELLK